jgi:hypothetical protein
MEPSRPAGNAPGFEAEETAPAGGGAAVEEFIGLDASGRPSSCQQPAETPLRGLQKPKPRTRRVVRATGAFADGGSWQFAAFRLLGLCLDLPDPGAIFGELPAVVSAWDPVQCAEILQHEIENAQGDPVSQGPWSRSASTPSWRESMRVRCPTGRAAIRSSETPRCNRRPSVIHAWHPVGKEAPDRASPPPFQDTDGLPNIRSSFSRRYAKIVSTSRRTKKRFTNAPPRTA